MINNEVKFIFKIKVISIITVIVIIIFGIVIFFSNKNDLKFSGYDLKKDNLVLDGNENTEPKVNLFITKDNKIENIKLEEYVRGVISAEMPVEFNIEALKAQAVAARTYAIAHMGECGGKQYDKQRNIDLNDTVECQVYINEKNRLSSWPENKRKEYWDKINDAVNSTRAEVITYSGEPVGEPFFFSCSSGNTENSEDVFISSEPYLRSVPSYEDKAAPEYESTVKITNADFVSKVNSKYSSSKLQIRNLKNQINVIKRSESGSIKEIKVGSITMTGLQFRSILGLHSANISIKYYSNYVELSCKGYGHGVGMSQWGANFMGKSGKTYKEILKHYYQGVEVGKLKYK